LTADHADGADGVGKKRESGKAETAIQRQVARTQRRQKTKLKTVKPRNTPTGDTDKILFRFESV